MAIYLWLVYMIMGCIIDSKPSLVILMFLNSESLCLTPEFRR